MADQADNNAAAPTVGVALLGMGTVGTEVLRILQEDARDFTARTGGPIEVRGIAVSDLTKPRPGVPADLLTDDAVGLVNRDDIDLVIQADAPDEYKTYLHRAGRTGRAGKKGTVVTIISRSRARRMDELLGRAEIAAEMVTVTPGDRLVSELAADQAPVALDAAAAGTDR